MPEQGLQPPELHGDGRLAAPNHLRGPGETPCLRDAEKAAEQVGIDRAWTYHEIGIADTDHQHNSFPGPGTAALHVRPERQPRSVKW